MGRIRAVAQPLGLALAVLVFWEAAVRLFGVPDYLLPTPTAILAELAKRWPRILANAWVTGLEIGGGFAIAVVVSLPLATGIAFSAWMARTVYPLIVTIQVVPKIAIAPIFVIWFGIGWISKLTLVFLLCFFPMLVNNVAGFRGINPEIMDFARSTGANAWRLFWRIRLPSALPSIFTGLRIGAVNAVTGAVVAEFIASDRGLGYLLLEYSGNLLAGAVFATVFVLSAIGLAVYYTVEAVERLMIPWHTAQRRDDKAQDQT
ncbi:MAG: ABC transporter permease [Alphaproteobacteria bacterium]|nr:ABC transporter permease [Alphaproteobacteria bacterium]